MLGSLLRSTSNSSGNTNTTITSPISSITPTHTHITPTAPDYPLRSPDGEIDISRTLSKLSGLSVGRDPKFDSGDIDAKKNDNDTPNDDDGNDTNGTNNSSSSNGDHAAFVDTKDSIVPSDRLERSSGGGAIYSNNVHSTFPTYRRTPSPLVRLVEGNNNGGSSPLLKTTVKTPRSGAASALLESLWEKNVQGTPSYSPIEKKSTGFHLTLRTKSNSTANLNISDDNHTATTVFPVAMTGGNSGGGGGGGATVTAKKFVYQHHPYGTRSSDTLINLSHSSLTTVKTASLNRINYSMCPVMEHISDDLKSKLFGAKTFYSPDTNTNTSASSNISVGTTPNYTKGNKTLYSGSGLRCMLTAQEDAQFYPFRILILEETDQLALRDNHRLIWDYCSPKSSSIGKISANELKQYIFGSFIRVRDNNKLDQLNEKFRAIPNSNFAIISRIFYCNINNNNNNSDYREGTRSKYALSLCTPKFLMPVVPELWLSISKWMNETQKTVGGLLLDMQYEREQKQRRGCHSNGNTSAATECDSTGSDTGNKERIRSGNFDFCNGSCPVFTSHNSNIGSNSQMILLNQRNHKELHKIVASVRLSLLSRFRSASEVPRLFLFPKDSVKFIKTWFNDCFKWIEIKDGPKLKFLQTLLAVIILGYKDAIIQNNDNNTRIYVLSSNMAVANKLIFLIAGLLNSNFKCNLALINANSNESDDSESNCSNNDNTHSNKVTVPIDSNQEADGDQNALNTSTCSFKSSSELSSSPASMTPTNTGTTPESNSASSSFISLVSMSPARSIYQSTSKGWEIPKKSASSSSIAPIYVSPLGTPLDAFSFPTTSSFKAASSSLQYLSTSLSSRFEFSLGSGHSLTQRNKKAFSAMHGASIESTESGWERASMRDSAAADAVPRSSSNSSLFFKVGSSLAAFPSATLTTPKQCPSTPEYDEALWAGTMDTPSSTRAVLSGTPTETSTGSRERSVDQSQDFHIPHSQGSFLEDVDIRRDAQRISQIEVINRAFKEICANDPLSVQEAEYEIDDHLKTVAPVVDIKLELSEEFKEMLRFDELLPRFTSYVPQLDEFFAVQGLPITSEVNSQITNLMRNELAELVAKPSLDSGISGHPSSRFRITKNDRIVKSLIVSLRTREIYEIYMKMDMNTGKTYKKVHQIFNLNGLIAKRDSKLQNCIEFVTDIFQKVKTNGEGMSQAADGEITKIFQLLLNYK